MSDRVWMSPTKVTHIVIERVVQVECPDHGVIDAVRTYREAVMSRREHWFAVHNGGRKGKRTTYAGKPLKGSTDA